MKVLDIDTTVAKLMKNMKYTIIIVFLFSITACNNQIVKPISDLNTLCQCWKYSYEESEDEISIYRPCSYNFPPSRGREGMTFVTNNTFIYSAIAPTDGFTKLEGNWTLENDILTMNYTVPNPKTNKFVLISLTKEMMKLKK